MGFGGMGDVDRFAIPEVPDAVMLEDRIAALRKEINGDCSELLRQAQAISRRGMGNFSMKLWESRVSLIMEHCAGTFSIDELKALRKECRGLLLELRRFG
jgi:hypothetical protein